VEFDFNLDSCFKKELPLKKRRFPLKNEKKRCGGDDLNGE
jgi:hypothetical protein